MPRRANPFQRLITLIEKTIAHPGAKVTESRELLDKITGYKREVEIVIETSDGIHNLIISVECAGGRSRPATIEWAERMWGKYGYSSTK